MKILLITDLYPIREAEYTTPKTLHQFVTDWQNLGHDVKVIKPNFLFNSFIRKKPYYKTGWYNNVYNVNYVLPFLGNIKSKLKEFFITKFEPDIVIAHMPSGILFADKLGMPFIAGIHCSDIEVLTNPIYSIHFKKRLEKALSNAQKISCRSFVIKNKLLSLYPEFQNKTFAAPSGIEEKYLQGIPLNNINKNEIKILTCANLKKRKNIDKLIIAADKFKNIKLTVIGDGKEINKLKKLSSKPNFIGRLPHEKVLNIMKTQDIFILPSIKETFGMVYLEAMAGGCITVCTENDGIDGIIKNNYNGFTVKPEIPAIQNIIDKISNLNSDEILLIRQNAINTAKEYSSINCAKEYLEKILA